MVPNKKKVLPVTLSFEVKITDIIDFYELKYRMCANRLRMTEWQDCEIFYAPTTGRESLIFMIAIASEKNKEISFIDASDLRYTICFRTSTLSWIVSLSLFET